MILRPQESGIGTRVLDRTFQDPSSYGVGHSYVHFGSEGLFEGTIFVEYFCEEEIFQGWLVNVSQTGIFLLVHVAAL